MANKPTPAQPINRNGIWYLVRRVPQHLTARDAAAPLLRHAEGRAVCSGKCCGIGE